MSPRWKKESRPQVPIGSDVEPFESPDVGSRPPSVSPTARAYAAAREALAAEMVGPLYGRVVEPEPEPAAPAAEVAAPLAERSAPVAQVAYTTARTPRPPVRSEPPQHRRALVAAAGLLLIGALALGTETLPLVLRTQPGAAVAANDPTAGATQSDSPGSASASLPGTPTLEPTPAPSGKPTSTKRPTAAPARKLTAAPTRKPASTPAPTQKPTPTPTPRPTATPTPRAIFATWATDPPVPPAFRVRTLSGAVCQVTRVRSGATRKVTSPQFTANGTGLAVLNWTSVNWTSGRTYTLTATCTLAGKSATTPTRQVTIR